MKQSVFNRREMLKAMGLLGAGVTMAACGPTGVPVAPTAAPGAEAAATAPAAAEGLKYEGITLRMLIRINILPAAGGRNAPTFR